MTYEEAPVRILLASTDETNIRKIDRALLDTASRTCTLNRCASLADAVRTIEEKGETDILVLDLEVLEIATPEDIYRQVEAFPAPIPIIIFTKSSDEEHNLALSAMADESCSHIIQGAFSRLPEAIGFSLLRQSKRDFQYSETPQEEQQGGIRIISWVTGDHDQK